MGRSSQMKGLGNKMGKSNARILRLVQLYSVSSSPLVLSQSSTTRLGTNDKDYNGSIP